MTGANDGKKWYREPYVWLVIIFPAMAIIGGMITAWLAVRTDDGLVADDYYKRGLEINRDIARDQAAGRYELQAEVAIIRGKKILQMTLHGNDRFRGPETIALTFLHPTRGGQDRQVTLRLVSGAVYEAELPELPEANWYLLIEADDWRLQQKLYIAKN